MSEIAKSPKVVFLGRQKKGVREVRFVLDAKDPIPEDLPEGFTQVPLKVGEEIPQKFQVYTNRDGFFDDPDRALQDQAQARFPRLFAAWKRLRELRDFQKDYPKIDISQEIAEAQATLDSEESFIPSSLLGSGGLGL